MNAFEERPLFFPSARAELYGVLSLPAGPPARAVLVTAGFGEEKKAAWRNVVELCRTLAGRGVASLRFDLTGTGDSDAEFSSCTVDDWTEDLRRAAAFLLERTGAPRLDAACLRLGCLLFAAAGIKADRLLLVAPPASGAAFMREEFMRKQLRAAISGLERESVAAMEERLKREGVLDLDGLELGLRLWEGLRELDWDSLRLEAERTLVLTARGGEAAAQAAAKAASGAAEVGKLEVPSFWAVTEHHPVPELYETAAAFFSRDRA